MTHRLKAITTCTILLFGLSLAAQTDSTRTPRPRSLDRLLNRKEVKVDSTKLLYYYLDNIHGRDSFRIRGLERHFQQYDPARNRDFDYGHLGNMGSAAYSTLLNLDLRKRYRLGYTAYDLYHKSEKDIRHFEQERPFSELYFSGGETQSDLRFKALFSRSFANNVNWVIDYDRISQVGIYDNQDVKQTSLLTSLAYRGHNRLSTFLTYIINSSVESVNGGVVDLADLSDPVNTIRQNVDVFSTDASNRLQNQSIIFNAFYKLGRDSTISDFQNSIQYQAHTYNEFYRFTDPNSSSDSTFYESFFVSDRGIRNYNEHFRLRNGIFVNSSFKEIYRFRAGAYYDYNAIDYSGRNEILNELYLSFNGFFKLKNRLSLDVDFYYGLFDIANEFGVDTKANLKFNASQGFNFGFIASRFDMNAVQENVFLNQNAFYENDFTPTFLQSLMAEYYHSNWNLKIGGRIQNTFNFVYFDERSLPVQDAGLFATSQIYTVHDLQIGMILIENSMYLQNTSKQYLNLPSVFTKNSLSFKGLIFKEKMLLKAGLDFRYIIAERLPFYNPIIGQFYFNTEEDYQPYPMLDARIAFKVSNFTTFAKYENLTSFLRNDAEMLVQNYPQFDARFRFGIQWNLWN